MRPLSCPTFLRSPIFFAACVLHFGQVMEPVSAAEPATYEFGGFAAVDHLEPGVSFSAGFAATGHPTYNYVTVYQGDLSATLGNPRPPAGDAPAGSNLRFGHACAWHDDTLFVGAPGYLQAGMSQGRIYCFTRSAPDSWTAAGTIENPDPARAGFGHRLLVAGNSLFVMSEGLNGKVHEFQKADGSGSWSLAGAMNLPANPNATGTTQDPAVVSSLASDGTNLVMGIGRGEDDRGLLAIYRKSGPVWQEMQRLTGPAGTTGRFGSAACFADGELLVGAPRAAGPGRIARYRFSGTGVAEPLDDLVLPNWVKGAGASIAHHDGRIMVGAPSSSFNPVRSSQGAILIADRNEAGTGWIWTGGITDPAWDNISFGSRVFASADRFIVESTGWGKVYQTLEPGPRLSYAFLPPTYGTDEDAALVQLGIVTSRPVNTVQIFERGALGGTATEGADYVMPLEIDFLYPENDWHELPILITKDSLAEPTENIRMDQVSVWGADRFGDTPEIWIADRAPRDGELPPRVIGHVVPPVTELRDIGYFPAPYNMSMSDDELLLGYYRDWGDNQPRLLRHVRNSQAQWVTAPALHLPPPSLSGDRRVQPGALVHDDGLILLGEDGDIYTRGHIRSYVKDGSGNWASGPPQWPSGTPVGTFGSEIILTPDWVFANQGPAQSGHSGFVHAFRRQGGNLTLHSVLKPSDAGLTGGDWGSSRAVFGNQIAWSHPYLAASVTTPGTNALQNRGIALFRWNEAAGKFDYLQQFHFQQVAMQVEILEFSQGMLIAGHDDRKLRCYVPRASGFFEEVAPQLPPADLGIFQSWSVPSPRGFLVGMQESQGYYTFAAVPQAVGFERDGDTLRPTLGYIPIFPWYNRGELYSNVSPAGRFAVMHADPEHRNRREVFIVEMGRDLPRLTLTPEVNEVTSTRESVAFTAELDIPATMPFPLVLHMEGINGGKANRDFAPAAKTRFLEAGETTAQFSFRLLDNPEPVAGAAVRTLPSLAYGVANPDQGSPSVAYRKLKTDLPMPNQRLIPTPGTSFGGLAFDGQDLLFRRAGAGYSGHATRPRNGRLFAEVDGPTFSGPGQFPRTDSDSHSTSLHGDLVVLGSPGIPGRSRDDSLQFGRKTGPGQWLMAPPIPGPHPYYASSLGSQTASNGRFLAVAQNKDDRVEPLNKRMLFHVFDIAGDSPTMIGSVASSVPMLGSPLLAIDRKDRLFYREFTDAGAGVAVARLSPNGITPAGTINPARDPRITWTNTFGVPIRCAGNFVIAGDSAAQVDGLSVGVVYVLEETPAGWETRQILMPPDPVFIGSFGDQIVVERDWLIIGEPLSLHGGSIHFYRARPGGYDFVKSVHAFTPPVGLDRGSALGGHLVMKHGCLLAAVMEQHPSGSNQAVYSFDLTTDESFDDWRHRMGLAASAASDDLDGDGLDLWFEWATGNDPGTRDTWWGREGNSLWFASGTTFNPAVKLSIDFSEDLSEGSWRTVAVRDGLNDWQGATTNGLLSLSFGEDGKERIRFPLEGRKGFYRMTGSPLPE